MNKCPACINWNHWHDTPDGACEDPRCECTYRPKAINKLGFYTETLPSGTQITVTGQPRGMLTWTETGCD